MFFLHELLLSREHSKLKDRLRLMLNMCYEEPAAEAWNMLPAKSVGKYPGSKKVTSVVLALLSLFTSTAALSLLPISWSRYLHSSNSISYSYIMQEYSSFCLFVCLSDPQDASVKVLHGFVEHLEWEDNEIQGEGESTYTVAMVSHWYAFFMWTSSPSLIS